MGEIFRKLQIGPQSREGFLRLIGFLLENRPPRRMVTAHRTMPPPREPFELYPHTVFDWVLSGQKAMTFDGAGNRRMTEPLLPGDVFLLPPSAWKLPLWNSPHELFCIVLQKNFLRLTCVELEAPTGVRPVCSIFHHTALPPPEELQTLAALLIRLGGDGDPAGAAPELLRALLRLVRRALEDEEAADLSKSQKTFRRIRQYLLENYTSDVTRGETAERFHLNPAYLSRLFRTHAECTFSEFLIRLRLAHAAMLLRETDLLLDAVADRCGYRSTTFFSAAFRARYGVPPGRYRLRRAKAPTTRRTASANPPAEKARSCPPSDRPECSCV